MIKITKENIQSMLQSIQSASDTQKYVEDIWTHIEEYNPVLLDFSLAELAAFDSEEEQNGFLTGMSFCYEMFRREQEALDLENM